MITIRKSLAALVFGVAIAMVPAGSALAETAVGSSVENRLLLAFKVNDEAVQALMPGGWKALTLPKGPLSGTNMILSFIERDLVLDPESKPATPHQDRAMAVLAYGVRPDIEGARIFITHVFERTPMANTYGNSIEAEFTHEKSVAVSGGEAPEHDERWVIRSGDGALELSLTYARGVPDWSEREVRPYSAANPEFFRIYRYEQLADLVMSAGLEKPLKGEVAFSSSISDLASVFDGSEELRAITVIPVYVREISLP